MSSILAHVKVVPLSKKKKLAKMHRLTVLNNSAGARLLGAESITKMMIAMGPVQLQAPRVIAEVAMNANRAA